MSDENTVEVPYTDSAASIAGRLLAAASTLGLPAAVVRTTSDNLFLVPESVADEAGLSYDIQGSDDVAVDEIEDQADVADVTADGEELEVPAGELEDRVQWISEGEDESERTKRANAVWTHEVDAGMTEAEAEGAKALIHAAVYGTEFEDPEAKADEDPETKKDEPQGFDASGLKGKSLEAALKERKLSTDGSADEKRARVAEFENTKE